ncbi:MAG TPA: carboxylesterase family protein, partial [Acidimicrobiales bacterium]|nr:carboxylesterase family protein [Acidimicrobiales bacterium]
MSDGIVELRHGRVRGAQVEGIFRFAGIPFAAPPVGADRWRPPREAAPWSGVRESVSFGPAAPQPDPVPGTGVAGDPDVWDDDCLSVNVWTPGLDGGRRPVLVYVHGGGFVTGASSSQLYDGHHLSARGDVVVVSFNYRLGVLGFLAHPALADEESGGHGNWGLLDVLAALRWVREHVSEFGGDPGNVTIFGESAGAMSVATLLSMPAAAGLFRRAIPQSGAGHHALPADTARVVSAEMARRLGVTPTLEDFAAIPVDRLVATQLQLSADIVLDPDRGRWREVSANGMAFEPVVDGQVLPARPIDGIAGGNGRGVDLLVGTNRHEHALF